MNRIIRKNGFGMRTFFGFSWVGIVNYFFLQFFFVRIQAVMNGDTERIRYRLLRWVVPFTGWSTDFRYVTITKDPASHDMDVLARLMSELPKDTVVASYLDGNPPVTAEKMVKLAEDKDPTAKQFYSDMMRTLRDLYIRNQRRVK